MTKTLKSMEMVIVMEIVTGIETVMMGMETVMGMEMVPSPLGTASVAIANEYMRMSD